jgi:4-amino-4-deoxy-L-arabinose transferase-like glycosyltransferase
MTTPSTARAIKGALAVVTTIVLLRLLCLPFPDLIDTTEGRYASVAKLMFDRNDWVTPWIYFGGELRPYQGKPPLHFWLMETSYTLFGVHAWSARFPSLFSALIVGILLFIVTARKCGTPSAWAAICIFGTSTLLFFLSGACILDITLTVGVTLALVGFALADQSRVWSNLFFVGLGIGVLVKGPLAVALAVLTIAPWAILRRWATGTWPTQIRSLRWIQGISAFVLIVAPWYLIQEYRNPGFLRYFIWNENLARYLVKDYGDEYGTGHKQPFATSWLMLFIGLTPWSFVVLPALAGCKWRGTIKEEIRRWIAENPWTLYGLVWMASCPFLFTFARQYTATYFVPSIPGFSLMIAAWWHSLLAGRAWSSTRYASMCRYAVFAFGLVSIIGGLASLRFGAPTLGVITACVCGTALCWYATRREGFSEMLPSVSKLALATGLVYALVIVCFSEHISMNRSSRRALEMASRVFPQPKDLTIGFPFYFPFSATFYGTTLGERSIKTMLLKDNEIGSAAVDAILARGSNAQRLMESDPQRAVLGRVGRWTLFEGNTNTEPVEP